MPSEFQTREQGFTFIEVLISLGLTSLLFMVLLSFFSVSVLKNHSRFTIEATAIASTELEGVRMIPFTSIANQTSAPFFSQLYTTGTWTVATAADQILSGTSAGASGLTGLIRVPANGHQDYETSVNITVPAGAPIGWGAGLALRAQEIDRLYRYYVSSSQLILDKVEPTGTTSLSINAYAIAAGTPITLGANIIGNIFTITANGLTIATVTDTDASWQGGDTGLIMLNGTDAVFDDIMIDAALVSDGDFESVTTGTLPGTWSWLQPASLPSGGSSITIADYNADDAIKEITATVSWKEEQRNRALTLKTLISR